MISPARASSEIAKPGLRAPDVREAAAAPRTSVLDRLRAAVLVIGERSAAVRPEDIAPAAANDVRGLSKRPGRPGGTLATKSATRITRGQLTLASFILGVVLPSLVAYLYLAVLAAPQYRSETRFVVRGELETVPGSGAAVGGLPAVGNSQEARVLVDYLRSRAMVDALEQQMDLRRIFGRTALDPLFRLSPGTNEEGLLAYWNGQVKVDLEAMSGVIKVQVSAFSPESAAMLAAAVVRQAELVTNDLTIRNRGDRVLQAETEERMAFTELALARTEIESFRNTQGTLDPTRSAAEAYIVIAKLRDLRSGLNTDLTAARAKLDENSPVVRALKERLQTLDDKIKALDTELLGGSKVDVGTSANIAAGAELEARRRLAEQRLKQAEAELLEARTQQARKQVYVLTFQPPTLPAEKAFPKPLPQAGLVFAVLLAGWSLVFLYVGSVYSRTR